MSLKMIIISVVPELYHAHYHSSNAVSRDTDCRHASRHGDGSTSLLLTASEGISSLNRLIGDSVSLPSLLRALDDVMQKHVPDALEGAISRLSVAIRLNLVDVDDVIGIKGGIGAKDELPALPVLQVWERVAQEMHALWTSRPHQRAAVARRPSFSLHCVASSAQSSPSTSRASSLLSSAMLGEASQSLWATSSGSCDGSRPGSSFQVLHVSPLRSTLVRMSCDQGHVFLRCCSDALMQALSGLIRRAGLGSGQQGWACMTVQHDILPTWLWFEAVHASAQCPKARSWQALSWRQWCPLQPFPGSSRVLFLVAQRCYS